MSTSESGSCNSGTIVGQSVGVEDNCFTSRLNVTISEGLNDRNVQCDHDWNLGTTNIGSATLNVLGKVIIVMHGLISSLNPSTHTRS